MPMNRLLSLLTLGTLLAAPAVLPAKITRTIDKSFPVQPGGNFKATTQGGDITIQTADTAEVHVTAYQVIRASTDKEADEKLEGLTLTFEQHGNDVVVESKYERSSGFRWGNW